MRVVSNLFVFDWCGADVNGKASPLDPRVKPEGNEGGMAAV